MAKIKDITESTPSAELVKAAAAEVLVVDTKGRSITLKKPGVLAQFRLVKILGESAKNEVYMGMIMPMIFISAIDGQVVPFPNTELEIEALIQRLDEDGVSAVMQGVQDNFGNIDPKKDKEAVKN